jgi:hypothetical protein
MRGYEREEGPPPTGARVGFETREFAAQTRSQEPRCSSSQQDTTELVRVRVGDAPEQGPVCGAGRSPEDNDGAWQ